MFSFGATRRVSLVRGFDVLLLRIGIKIRAGRQVIVPDDDDDDDGSDKDIAIPEAGVSFRCYTQCISPLMWKSLI